MPTGKRYLGACTADLRDIVDIERNRTIEPLTLVAGITWHNPSQNSPFAVEIGVYPDSWHPLSLGCDAGIEVIIPVRHGGGFHPWRGSCAF